MVESRRRKQNRGEFLHHWLPTTRTLASGSIFFLFHFIAIKTFDSEFSKPIIIFKLKCSRVFCFAMTLPSFPSWSTNLCDLETINLRDFVTVLIHFSLSHRLWVIRHVNLLRCGARGPDGEKEGGKKNKWENVNSSVEFNNLLFLASAGVRIATYSPSFLSMLTCCCVFRFSFCLTSLFIHNFESSSSCSTRAYSIFAFFALARLQHKTWNQK